MNDVDRRVIELHVDTLANETKFKELLKNLLESENIITQRLEKKYQVSIA